MAEVNPILTDACRRIPGEHAKILRGNIRFGSSRPQDPELGHVWFDENGGGWIEWNGYGWDTLPGDPF